MFIKIRKKLQAHFCKTQTVLMRKKNLSHRCDKKIKENVKKH